MNNLAINPFARDSNMLRCRNCGNSTAIRSCKDSYHLANAHHPWSNDVDSHSSSISSSTSSLLSFNSSEALEEIGCARNRSRRTSQVAESIWQRSKENPETLVSELARALFESDSGVQVSQKAINSAGQNINSFHDKWITADMDIQALMRMYRLKVDEREKELLNELTASVAVKTSSLKREINTYAAIQSSYDRSLRVLENVLQDGRPYDILRAKGICDLEIEKARDLQEFALFPEDEIVFIPPGEEVLNGVRHMGKITIDQNPASPFDKASRPSLGQTQSADKKPANAPQTQQSGSPANPKMNAWTRPIKFTEEPKQIRAIIPHLSGNPKPRAINVAKFDNKVAGQPKLIIGQDGSLDGELSRPWGVCCSDEGNIIVADRSNHRIQIFNPQGEFILKFGRYGKEAAGHFDRPAGVAVDPRGRIFITDKDNHRIQVFTQAGEFVFMFGKEGKQGGQFQYPWDISVNSVGQVAVSDTRNQRIQLFSNNGTLLKKFGIENVFFQRNHLDLPRGICFNTEGNILVTDFNNHRLLVIESSFKEAKFLGGPGTGTKQFMRPQGVAVDNKGKIAIADSRNNRIQIINEDGTYVWQFGCGGCEPGQLDRPCGVCFTPDGQIVVVDFGNNRLQIF